MKFFCKGDIEVVSSSLKGCLYKEETIRAALRSVNTSDVFYMIDMEDLIKCIIG